MSYIPGGGTGAPADATYITQTANGSLSNEQALAALATGIVKVTTTTGVLSTAVGADLPTHTHAAADITSGTVATARLGSGAASASTFLRGDQSWASGPSAGAMSMGELAFASNASATTITTGDTWTRVGIASTLTVNEDFDSPSAGRLRYIGVDTKMLHCGCTFSVKGVGANDTFSAMLYLNGTVNGNNEFTGGTALTDGRATIKLQGAGEISSSAIHDIVEMATNDIIELAIKNISDTDDLTVIDMNLFAVGMPSSSAVIADGDKGDVTVSGAGTTWTIDNGAVTLAKIVDASGASKLLGRGSAGGAGDFEEITLGTGLSMAGTVLSSSGSGIADGATLVTGLTFPNTGLHLLDTNATHDLILAPGSDLSADRTLTLTTGDADRTLTINSSTTLGGGSHSGTNTGDVTLAGTPDYITISGQQITRGSIDLTTDVTGVLPHGNLGTGGGGATKFLREDSTFQAIAGGGDVVGDDTTVTVQNIVAYNAVGGKNITELTGTQGDVLYHNGTNWAKLGVGTSGHFLKTQGAAANPAWSAVQAGTIAVAGIVQFAAQADQEGSVASLAVQPSVQHFHPSAAKFWVCWTANSTTILASYNVDSIADTAVGDADGTITTDFSSANWNGHCTTLDATNSWDAEECQGSGFNARAAGTFGVLCSTITDGGTAACSLTDPDSWNVCGFGDHA